MKKTTITSAIMAMCLMLSSCVLPGSSTGTNTTTGNDAGNILGSVLGSEAGGDILNSLLGTILSKTLTEESIYGTWVYQSPEVRFESESLLAKAGGEIAAQSIERKLDSYLTKVGIKQGVTTYTFNQDKTYSITTGGKTISSGTYTFNAKNKTLKMQGTLGLMNQNCTIGMDGTNLCILYDADKLLTVANSVGSILGQVSSTVGSVAGIFGENYKGMKLGLAMSRK